MIVKRTGKADAVLAVLDDITRDRQDPQVVIHATPYHNGRENGWRVHTDDSEGAVVFSENRNSDNIVVYVQGADHKYADSLSEGSYEKRKLLCYDDYLEAAKFIAKSLGIN